MAAGRSQTIPGLEEQVRQLVNKALSDANVKDGGLTFGKVQHGESAGKMDACYSTIKTVTGTAEYEVPHTLGHIPGFCLLMHSENRVTTSQYSVAASSRDKWSSTTCRVNVRVEAGSLDGGELTFMVGGSR